MSSPIRYTLGLLLIAAAALTSCEQDVENIYSNIRAFFRFSPVTAAPQLNAALNNPGMFCTVTFTNTHYVFTDSEGRSTPVARTALDAYGRPEFVEGFIIGMPSLPDANSNFYNVAFDLVCPNCYTDDAIRRRLAFSSLESMTCSRCSRTYNLNNNGYVVSGDKGRHLYRYRLSYSQPQNAVVIQN